MGQAPSLYADSSSYSNEAVQSEESAASSAVSDDFAGNRDVSASQASLRHCRSPAEMSSNIQTPQIRGRGGRIRDRSQRRPNRVNTHSTRRVDSTSSRRNGQRNVNQQSASLYVGTKQRSEARVERGVYENEEDTENYIYVPNSAGLRIVPKFSHFHSKTNKEPYEVNTKGTISARSSSMPLFPFDDPFGSPPLIAREFSASTADVKKIARHLIKLSRYLKCPNFSELRCLDCRHVPVLPVTGQCGHTRCMRCIVDNGACPCSVKAPKSLIVNTVIREIIDKMVRNIKEPRIIETITSARAFDFNPYPLNEDEPRLPKQRHSMSPRSTRNSGLSLPRVPMTIQARYYRARHLMAAGNYLEAAAHLARVAASSEPFSRTARMLLSQAISALCKKQNKSIVSRSLRRGVREQAARSWLHADDLECVLCTGPYACPVSTPCGHTFCRECIERSLYYSKKCALCLSSLEDFNVTKTRDTVFISSMLSSMDVVPLPGETDVLPVVTCHVAYPGMPCPLFVFNPRCCEMVQRILRSGSRRFGMLGCNSPNYGTILEVRDCVVFEDRRCIVSTVGVSRFRIIEVYKSNGTDVGRIQRLTDIDMNSRDEERAVRLAVRVHWQALCWLRAMRERKRSVREEIDTAFGSLPDNLDPTLLGNSPDGPFWLWWIIAILPLKQEVKTLILTTRSLVKRLAAVSRALEVVDSDVTTHANDLSTGWP